ncbi:MAG: hypothetical protein F6K32_22675, partial [Desertifilum sp. SIO1I2]|nr:hypothetical protein [Desertifilum sp. SIO1I2]
TDVESDTGRAGETQPEPGPAVRCGAENRLKESGKLSWRYRRALAKAYYDMGREYLYSEFPHQLPHAKYLRHREALKETLRLYPPFKASDRKLSYRLIQKTLGIHRAEMTSYYTTRFKMWLKEQKGNWLPQSFLESNWSQSSLAEVSED